MNENRYGFIPSEPKVGDFVHGDNLLGTVAISPSGDWSLYLPQPEYQNRGFETYCCVSEAILHCTEILQRKKYTDPTDYSVRFLAKQSGTDERGGNDTNTVSEVLRKGGCCQEVDYPFGVKDFKTFYASIPSKIIELAKAQFRNDNFGHSWILDTSPNAMKDALQYSPLALSVYAWNAPIDDIYYRPTNSRDNHCICVYGYEDGKYWKIFDSYDNTHKKLDWNYGFGIGKRMTLDRVIPNSPNASGWINWTKYIAYIRNWLGL